MGSDAQGANTGPSRRLVKLEGNSRHAHKRYRLYGANTYGPSLTRPERLRRLGRDSELAEGALPRAKSRASHAKA